MMDIRTTVEQIEKAKTIDGVFTALDRAGIPTGYNLRFTMRLARAENSQPKMQIIKAAMTRLQHIENGEI